METIGEDLRQMIRTPLARSHVETLRAACKVATYPKGSIMVQQGEKANRFVYVEEGEIEAVADDRQYLLRAGDVFWTSVGCIHGFRNTSRHRVRWLETQSPQLPARYGYRFNRDWEYLADRLAAQSDMRAAKIVS